jgi:transposase
MIAKTTIVGIDVSRDWLDGFCLPDQDRFRLPNTTEGHNALIALIRQIPGQIKVGFEATGGQEWVLWTELAAAEIAVVQLPPAQIKAFALSRGTRAKTDRIDAELIAKFMAFRPEVGRKLPDENLRILRTLTTRRGQLVDMRKRLKAQISARRKQGVSADVDTLDDDLRGVLDTQISTIEGKIENLIAQTDQLASTARLLRSIPGIGPVCAAMLLAEMPELGRMTAGQAAAMTGLAPVAHDSGAMRGKRMIAGGRRSLRHVLYQAALAAACHNPVLKPAAKRLKERGKPHKLVIVAIAWRMVAIANAVIKSGKPWQIQHAR